MKKGKMVVTCGIASAAIVSSSIVLYKVAKKNRKLKKEIKDLKEELDFLTGEEEKNKAKQKFKEETIGEEENLVKSLYVIAELSKDETLFSSEKMKRNVFNIDEAINNENVLHVMDGGSRNGDPVLDFMFQLPVEEISSIDEKNNYSIPDIGRYISTINEFTQKFWDRYIIIGDYPKKKLLGYYILEYKDKSDKVKEVILEIPEELCPDRVSDYVLNYQRNWETEGNNILRNLNIIKSSLNFIQLGESPNNEDIEFTRVIDCLLFYTISFSIQKNSEKFGVKLMDTLLYCSHVVKDLTIKKNRSNIAKKYKNIMFHYERNMFLYYTVDIDNKDDEDYEHRHVVVSSFTCL